MRIATKYSPTAPVVLYAGDCLELLKRMPDGCAKLVVTSPPYNLSKRYEKKIRLIRRAPLAEYATTGTGIEVQKNGS